MAVNSAFGEVSLDDSGVLIKAALRVDHYKVGGITIDWTKVTKLPNYNASADKTLNDGRVIAAGTKYLRYGTVLCKIGVQEIWTITMDADGGHFHIIYAGGTPSAALDYNAPADTVKRAISPIFPCPVDVSLSSSVYTITFLDDMDPGYITTDVSALSKAPGGGGTGSATPAKTTAGAAGSSKYGPYDGIATDGRQNLRRGRCFILNETVTNADMRNQFPNAAFDAGAVYRVRVLDDGDDLIGNPNLSDFITAFPAVELVED